MAVVPDPRSDFTSMQGWTCLPRNITLDQIRSYLNNLHIHLVLNEQSSNSDGSRLMRISCAETLRPRVVLQISNWNTQLREVYPVTLRLCERADDGCTYYKISVAPSVYYVFGVLFSVSIAASVLLIRAVVLGLSRGSYVWAWIAIASVGAAVIFVLPLILLVRWAWQVVKYRNRLAAALQSLASAHA